MQLVSAIGMFIGGLLIGLSVGRGIVYQKLETQTTFCLAHAIDFELCAKQYGWIEP